MSRVEEVIEYINNIPRFTTKNKQSDTRKLLDILGNPEKDIRAVHIAGTNGKGSVAKMMSLILEEQGYKTGLFTSPHLVRMNERIAVNGEYISDADMVLLFDKVMEAINSPLLKDCPHPAFFEFLFLMAALYFKEQKCDYVVYETGLGGRLDATNIIIPEISIITSIGMDHMQYLGNTIKEIAGEKAGIIKAGIPVVYNTGDEEADQVIKEKAKELCSPEINVVQYIGNKMQIPEEINSIISGFSALYQKDNAYTAITAAYVMSINPNNVLSEEAEHIPESQKLWLYIKNALSRFAWSGRMEFVADNIVIDGAHNEDAIKRTVESVNYICKKDGWKKISLLFAVSSDKDYESIIRILTENLEFEDVYVGELDSERKQDAGTVMKLFQKYMPAEKHFDVVGYDNIASAWRLATSELTDDTLLLVVGSLYMVGEIKVLLK